MKTRYRIALVLAWAAAVQIPAPGVRAQDAAALQRRLRDAERQLEDALRRVPDLERRIGDRQELKATFERYRQPVEAQKAEFKKAYDLYIFYLERIVPESASDREEQIAEDRRRVDPRRRVVKPRWGGWLGIVPDWYKYGPYGKLYTDAEKEMGVRRASYYALKNRVNQEIRTGMGIGIEDLPLPGDYEGLATLVEEQEGVLAGLIKELEQLRDATIPQLRMEIANLQPAVRMAERDEREQAAAPTPGIAVAIVYEGTTSQEFQDLFQQEIQKAAQSGVTVTRESLVFTPMRLRIEPRDRRVTVEPVNAMVSIAGRNDNPNYLVGDGDMEMSGTLVFSPTSVGEDGRIVGTYQSQSRQRTSGAMRTGGPSAGTQELPWRAVPEGALEIESEGLRLPASYLIYLGNQANVPPMFRLQCRGTQSF